MKSIQQIRVILLGGFCGGFFIAQLIGWSIINYVETFGKFIWCIIGTVALMTVITCSMYLLLQLFQRFRRCEDAISVDNHDADK